MINTEKRYEQQQQKSGVGGHRQSDSVAWDSSGINRWYQNWILTNEPKFYQRSWGEGILDKRKA